ncbi:unnamed protein product [Parascedosporium putredinis]|uniref:Xylanolytic transcriptional activator regulatory domain-containing protein n=1 Tax=Parascedosporium putredinis TaxID=1442378 RepID=A0A9P1M8B1_9PEZI|nr:unnamed protein product [Parascedosporium putredinis]CAI7989569.1 unnamed protein product [Parascedosporium putredinis]
MDAAGLASGSQPPPPAPCGGGGRHRGAQASAPAPTAAQADAGASSTVAGASLVLPLRPSRTDSISPAATSFTDSLVFTAEPELQTPSPDPLEGRDWAKVQLVQIFLDRIDPVFKVLHRPSVSLHLIQGKSYLDYEPGHPTVVALDRAIFYAAACAMDESECVPVFDMGKRAAVAGLRVAIEAALARAGLLSTEDITVLQAFVLYLVATRTYDRTRQVWTLMSLAYRIAQALGLQIDPPPGPMKPFDIEMRRRLRYAIGLLDMQTFNLDSQGKLLDETGRSFTDMTFATLVARAQTVVRQINMTTQDGGAYGGLFQLHRGYVRDFRDAAIILLRHCRPDDDPFHWYVVQVTEWIIAQFHVAVERPLRRLPNYDPPRPDFSLLQVCAEILQRSQNIIGDSNVRFWNWSESVFNPWHALAVALAELCTCPDPVIVESYWDLVERAYAHSADLMERSRSEVSWGPMEKLMKKARAHRNSLLQAHGV